MFFLKNRTFFISNFTGNLNSVNGITNGSTVKMGIVNQPTFKTGGGNFSFHAQVQ